MIPIRSAESRCPCGGEFANSEVEVVVQPQGGGTAEPMRFENVVKADCRECGTRVYSVAVIQRLEAAIREQTPRRGRPGVHRSEPPVTSMNRRQRR